MREIQGAQKLYPHLKDYYMDLKTQMDKIIGYLRTYMEVINVQNDHLHRPYTERQTF